MVHLASGSADVSGNRLVEGDAYYIDGFLDGKAGAQSAELWRSGIVRDGEGLGLIRGAGVSSTRRMLRAIKMFELTPTSKWLCRLDTIIDFEGTTGLHFHPGSGIRCLLSGCLRTQSEKGEDTENKQRGDVWYEEGSYPIVSTVDGGVKTTFLRGMIRPPEYLIYGETATWIEGKKPTFGGWRSLKQGVISLR